MHDKSVARGRERLRASAVALEEPSLAHRHAARRALKPEARECEVQRLRGWVNGSGERLGIHLQRVTREHAK